MPDPNQWLPNGGRAPRQRQVVLAQVSSRKPAPSSFTDPLFVVLDYDPDHAFRVDNWPVIHGATLPALGADVLLVFDDRHNARIAWWDGVHT